MTQNPPTPPTQYLQATKPSDFTVGSYKELGNSDSGYHEIQQVHNDKGRRSSFSGLGDVGDKLEHGTFGEDIVLQRDRATGCPHHIDGFLLGATNPVGELK